MTKKAAKSKTKKSKEPYAKKKNADGTITYYDTRRDYEAGRIRASDAARKRRTRINEKFGGRVV